MAIHDTLPLDIPGIAELQTLQNLVSLASMKEPSENFQHSLFLHAEMDEYTPQILKWRKYRTFKSVSFVYYKNTIHIHVNQ